MIPLKYNVRSLLVCWKTTLLTCIANGAVVFASVLTFAMIDGIEQARTASGDASDLLIVRKGSGDEMSSSVLPTAGRELANLPGGGVFCDVGFV